MMVSWLMWMGCASSPPEPVEPAEPPAVPELPPAVSGTVHTGGDEPLAGVLVTAVPKASTVRRSTFTDASGAFRLQGLDDGAYEVVARHRGWPEGTAAITVTEGQGPSVALTLDTAGEPAVPLPSPADLAGVGITEFLLPSSTSWPADLVAGPDGRAWMTSPSRGEVWALDPATGNVEAFGANGAGVGSLAFDAAGALWVAEASKRQLVELDVTSRDTTSFEVGTDAVRGIAFDDAGGVWFADDGGDAPTVGHLVPADGTVTRHSLPPAPGATSQRLGDLVYNGRSRLILSQPDAHAVTRVGLPDASSKVYLLPSGTATPGRLGIGPDGSIWIPEAASGKLTQFDPLSGSFMSTSLGEKTGPSAAAVHGETGRVWVSATADQSAFLVNPRSGAVRRIPLPGAFGPLLAVEQTTGAAWIASVEGEEPARVVRITLSE
ncbi:MAG: carboxypeptidase regulatory-like domain-containing protein [Myxococcales bacterium]|nr:carboxypeptidase regulatory-like domain-containing protein [Myxococcales bacterium]